MKARKISMITIQMTTCNIFISVNGGYWSSTTRSDSFLDSLVEDLLASPEHANGTGDDVV